MSQPDVPLTVPAGRSRVPLVRLPQPAAGRFAPTWRQARVSRITAAAAVAASRNPGGWYVAGASADAPAGRSVTRTISGREVVFFRDTDGSLAAGPGACPHMGALLDGCRVLDGTMFCRWHGYPLRPEGDASWRPYQAVDDGVLLWVQLSTQGEPSTERPVLPVRPPLDRAVTAVVVARGVCEPGDVIANRLDPWHGAWFHPYAFSHLVVDESASTDSVLTVDVAFRLGRTLGVPVRAEFSCPDARTIVMRIVAGEGAGSVVETHATPIGFDPAGQAVTVITEATMAYSDRPGFRVARWLAPMIRPGIRRTARRLWVDDLAYAERRYRLRVRGDSGR
jgi:nitrite reductase/ring-hydroxylating ferredoxin subunit